MRQPFDLALRIMELRSYAGAKELVERPGMKLDDLPNSPMVNLVREIETEIVMEQRGMSKKQQEA